MFEPSLLPCSAPPRHVCVHLKDVAIRLAPRPSLWSLLSLSSWRPAPVPAPVPVPVPAQLDGWQTLIHTLSVAIPAAKVFAILGGSGSGKTTLLNVIAGKYNPSHVHVEGSITFVDPLVHRQLVGNVVGYVTQEDFLLPFLTVRETLMYAARLRMGSSVTHDERCMRAEEVLLDLGLKECADTLIGDTEVRGVSGGERRRVSIAVQILTNPCVLALDEPTSGLDSFTANNVVQTLSSLAVVKSKTIICSLHQPRSDIFYMLDCVLLLSGGRPTYLGPVSEILGYFECLGYPCPNNSNPADYFVDISSVDSRTFEKRKIDETRVKTLVDAFHQHEGFIAVDLCTTILSVNDANRPSWVAQVSILASRFSVNWLRDQGQIWGGIVRTPYPETSV